MKDRSSLFRALHTKQSNYIKHMTYVITVTKKINHRHHTKTFISSDHYEVLHAN